MKIYQTFVFSCNIGDVAWRQKCVLCHKTGCWCNLCILCQICSKFLSHDKGPGLRSFTCQNQLKVPPLNLMPAFFHNSWAICCRFSWEVSLHSAEFHCVWPRRPASCQYPLTYVNVQGPVHRSFDYELELHFQQYTFVISLHTEIFLRGWENHV